MIKKVLAFLAAAVISAICFTACQLGSSSAEYKIYLISKSSMSTFWQTCIAGAKAAEVEYGNVSLSTMAPYKESDYERQNEFILQAIEEGADAIIFSACNYRKSTLYVEQALDNGIPVIIIDSDISSERALTFIGTDNYDAGRIAAQTIEEKLKGSGGVGVISFEEKSENSEKRVQGFQDYIDSVGGMEILEIKYSLSDYDTAQKSAEDMIKAYGSDLKAIATFNELTTIGVARAVEETENTSNIYVAGFDNNNEAIQKLEEGYLDSLVVQNPFAMGYLGVLKALDEINGKSAKETVYTGICLVTRENMYEAEIEKLLFPFTDK